MRTYDFVAIGVGPFNLGLACLTAPIGDLDGLFLERRDDFDWHPGLMIDGATIQVPFLADLVTMADPTSPFSFLNYLKEIGRLYPFYIRESFFPLRAEYNAYCRWAAAQLPRIHFGTEVERVSYDGSHYLVGINARGNGDRYTVRARRLVVGIGTVPYRPPAVRGLTGPGLIHSADYRTHKRHFQTLESITVIGSGQSAAEIYHDLLQDIDEFGYHLSWITRSPRFFPMEYTKLTLELTSPEYIRYFHELPPTVRDRLNRDHRTLYKGISGDLVNAIFDTLYQRSVAGPVASTLLAGTSLLQASWDAADARFRLLLRNDDQQRDFTAGTQGLVLATGYRPHPPSFLDPVRDRIRWDDQGRYAVSPDYAIDLDGDSIFVQNAEEHTHGFTAPDLGMGAHRNSVIIARMLRREVYPVERSIAFQQFGAPRGAEPAGQATARRTADPALRVDLDPVLS